MYNSNRDTHDASGLCGSETEASYNETLFLIVFDIFESVLLQFGSDATELLVNLESLS
jgi:hypothetical protein